MRTQPGVFRAPQLGLPRVTPKLTVREIRANKRVLSDAEIKELAKMLTETR